MIEIFVERGLKSKLTGILSSEDSVVVTLNDSDFLPHNPTAPTWLGWDNKTTSRKILEHTGPRAPLEIRVLYTNSTGNEIVHSVSLTNRSSTLKFPNAGEMDGLDNVVHTIHQIWKTDPEAHLGEAIPDIAIGKLPRARKIFERNARKKSRSKQPSQT